MIKKTIKYTTLDGAPVEGEWYFGLSKAELAKLELTRKGGSMMEYMQEIVKSEDGEAIIDTFEKLIRLSVGQRSEDGVRFIKTDEIRDGFLQTDAYSELFMELVTKADVAAEFINGILPADLAAQAKVEADKSYSDDELLAMSQADFEKAVGSDPMHMSKEHLLLAFKRKSADAA